MDSYKDEETSDIKMKALARLFEHLVESKPEEGEEVIEIELDPETEKEHSEHDEKGDCAKCNSSSKMFKNLMKRKSQSKE